MLVDMQAQPRSTSLLASSSSTTKLNNAFLSIQAINGHDPVACALLQKGADVTLYDDSGLTPVDVAKTKKVKATLKHAWTEATQNREPKNLAPVREGSARSFSSVGRRKGEVVFDVSILRVDSTFLDPKGSFTQKLDYSSSSGMLWPFSRSVSDLAPTTLQLKGVRL
jgi:hypothetical protein